jgi:hypothetical protein
MWEKEVGSEEMKGVGAPGKGEETQNSEYSPLTPEPAGMYFGGQN